MEKYAIAWDALGERFYETGVSKTVLYPFDADNNKYGTGVAWNGVSAINESPSGAEASPIYADNIKYLNLYSVEELGATIEAYQSPEEFDECDGTTAISTGIKIGQQPRKMFGLCYRTELGNDVLETEYGYILHLLYGCKASPSEKAHSTINDSPEAATLSWEITTTPVDVPGFKATASLEINSKKVTEANLAKLERILYGVTGPAYDATSTYEIGDIVVKDAKTYECVTAIETAHAWDADEWTEIVNPNPYLPTPAEIIELLSAQG